MKRPKKEYKPVVPLAGGEAFHEGEPGPLTYTYPMPPVKSRGQLIPVHDASEPLTVAGEKAGRPEAPRPGPARPLIPSSEEVAALPRLAREAFAARCAARAAHLRPGADTPEAVAALLLAAATTATPIRRQLLCLRRDLARLARLAREGNWTDDTPVPPDALGPLWPDGLAPDRAREPG